MSDDLVNLEDLEGPLHPYQEESRDVLRDHHDEYLREYRGLRDDLRQVNANLAALRTIQRFPLEFYRGHEEFLSHHLPVALYEHTVTVLWRSWQDYQERNVTLPGLRDRVLEWIWPASQIAVRRALERTEPSDDDRRILNQLNLLRNKRVGHADLKLHRGTFALKGWPSLQELEQVTQRLGRMLHALSFPAGDQYQTPEVELEVMRLLDSIAVGHELSLAYDQSGSDWLDIADSLRLQPGWEDFLCELNASRSRHGLRPIQIGLLPGE